MAIVVYGDESADEKKVRAFAVAALAGEEKAWAPAEAEWLERTGGEVFHAAEFESARGVTDPAEKQARLDTYRDLVQIIARSGLRGHGVGLDLVSMRKWFPELLLDAAYFKGLQDVIRYFGGESRKLTERHQIEFIFDNRAETEYGADLMYESLSRHPGWRDEVLFADKLGFATRKNPRIQMADLYARETMKALDRSVLGNHKLRKSMEALLSAGDGKFTFVFCVGDYFKGLRERVDAVDADPTSKDSDYKRWLKDKNAQDNWANRWRHAISFESKKSDAKS
jgi:hypothetical protein